MTDLSTLDHTPAEQRWPLLRRWIDVPSWRQAARARGAAIRPPGCCG